MSQELTVTKIVITFLKQKGFDGLHSHPENNKYGGCGCSIKEYCKEGCPHGDKSDFCEPAYKHTKTECKKCPDYLKGCDAFDCGEKYMYCGRKKV